ncbi:DUF3306 domain-containing protein [Massilia sp. CMS3.1]|uniref:DUF3306 domain-containing protein n=1 Tax=Massilia sp. CMS3.1 TaxID=3373083 RepID=UPI003EE80A48
MPEEGFLRRWARVKASGDDAVAEAPPRPVAQPPAVPAAEPVPAAAHPDAAVGASSEQTVLTIDDAAQLTPGSDFSAFVSRGVDKDVRRLALKKLFADPHFNVMDRLDMYMDDYNKPSPVSAAMLAGLQHARSALRRPEEVQAELARLAALDPPAHPGGLAQPMPVEVVEAQREETPIAEAADVELADESSPVEDAPVADGDLPDAQFPADEPAAMPAGEEQLPDVQPGPIAQDNDAVALAIVRAHNTDVRP